MGKNIILAAAAATCAMVFAAAPAQAQATRTFVSGVGNDANPCSRTAPCRTFAGAIIKTATGGEINCLDPGGYGGLTINKSLSIVCDYTEGGSLVAGAGVNGITINSAGAIVYLSGIDFFGVGTATNGVRVITSSTLTINNSRIHAFNAVSGTGVLIAPTSGTARVHIINTRITNNGTAIAGGGIRVVPTGSASVQLTLEDVHLTGNFRGIDAVATGTTAGNTITVTDGSIVYSTDNAINGASNANALNIVVDGMAIANNLRGMVLTGTGSLGLIGGSTVVSNGTAFAPSAGAVIQSYKDNRIALNTNNGTPLPQVNLE